jgi:hypothetical protein
MSESKEKLKARQPANARVDVQRSGAALELVHRRPQYGSGCFLVVWLTGWTAGCVMLLVQVIQKPEFFMVLFGIPFWASWVFVFCMVCWMFFGREALRLEPGCLEYSKSAFVRIAHRVVPADELVRAKRGSGQRAVTIETAGKPVHFGRGIGSAEQRWLVHLLNDYVDAAQRDTTRRDVENVVAAATDPEQPTRKTETILKLAKSPVKPPSETRLRLRREIRDLRFTARGRWDLAALGGATFIFLFWNGIVGVFIWQLIREFQWFLFFFLIPFEVIGLVIAIAWLGAILAPLMTISWRFGHREISRKVGMLGLGPVRRYQVVPLAHIKLRHRRGRKDAAKTTSLGVLDGQYALLFVTMEDDVLVEIPGLTRGEGRWIGDTALREFPNWFEY